MRQLWCFFIFCLTIGCGHSVSKGELSTLNGYWEIESVVFPDGTSKAYTVNTVVDYFYVEGLEGYRKKVQPKFDGTYDTSNDAEPFKITEVEGVLRLWYRNEMSEWSEILRTLSDTDLVLVNDEGISYRYKRFKPIDTTEK